MKNFLPVLALALCLLSSCSKKDGPIEEKKTTVTFQVSEFSQTNSPMSKAGASVSQLGDTLRNHANFLYAHIYSSSNTMAPLAIVQTADLPNFGSLSANLLPGNYIAVFVASKQEVEFMGTSRLSSLAMYPRMDDLFIINSHPFTVGSQNQTESIRLTRWIGAVELNIEDAIPANVSKIVIETPDNASGWVFSAGQYTGADQTFTSKEFVITDSDRGQTNRKFLMYILNQSWMAFKIKALDSNGVIIAEKNINPVGVSRNRKTILSGKLFSSAAAFTVAVNPEWEIPSAPVGF